MVWLSKEQVTKGTLLSMLLSTIFLAGCDTSNSDGDDSSDGGYIQFYNVSANSPAIFVTVDEDLDSSEDNEVENTYSSVEYTQSSGRNELDDGEYFIELGWQDEDSSARDDLTVIYQAPLEISDENISLFVLAEDITSPVVFQYDVAVIDDDNDDDEDLFNLRFLYFHKVFGDIDIYASQHDETFNEAELLTSATYSELSSNLKLEQGDYVFYLTRSGETEVLFQSSDITFQYSSQYVISVRENFGVDETPFVIDLLTNSSTFEYQHQGAQARLRAYNAIAQHDLLENYTGAIDLYLDTNSEEADVKALSLGQFSDPVNTEYGDYSVAITLGDSNEYILKNHLVSLSENSDKTVFFYTTESHVDDDNDGNVDEDGDGVVDEIELITNSLVVENINLQGVYDHNINIVNLVDDEDFGTVDVYFVRNNELIDDAEYKRNVPYTTNASITLLNNTYQVFAVATVDSSEVILGVKELVLNEESQGQFLILEKDEADVSGYKMTFSSQSVE